MFNRKKPAEGTGDQGRTYAAPGTRPRVAPRPSASPVEPVGTGGTGGTGGVGTPASGAAGGGARPGAAGQATSGPSTAPMPAAPVTDSRPASAGPSPSPSSSSAASAGGRGSSGADGPSGSSGSSGSSQAAPAQAGSSPRARAGELADPAAQVGRGGRDGGAADSASSSSSDSSRPAAGARPGGESGGDRGAPGGAAPTARRSAPHTGAAASPGPGTTAPGTARTARGPAGPAAATARGAGSPSAPKPPVSGLGPAAAPPLAPTLRPGAKVDLTTVLGPITIPNPVLTASGCAANGAELHRLFDISSLGAFVTKTVLADPRSGRGTPRMAETASGMLNSIGLQGPGITDFVDKDLAWLMSAGARVVVSIAGNDPREFASVAKTLVESPAFDACVGIEVNISCPNVANRGLVFACDPAATTEVIDRVRTQVPPGIPILVKLSPDVTDIVAIARAAVHAGADGLTMINTALGLEIDTVTMRPALAGITGGLSGPAIRPIARRAVWQVYAAMQAGVVPARPIVGVGGIRSGRDALAFLAAGATAIQVGTAIFNDPHAPVRVRDELSAELAARRIATPSDIVGIAHRRVPGAPS